MVEVWITRDGSLTVSIPNEIQAQYKPITMAGKISEGTKVQECHYCREQTAFKKNNHDEWYCTNCSTKENPQDSILPIPPFIRSLAYGGSEIASSWSQLKMAEKSIIFANRRNKKHLQKYLEKLEKQKDVDETCKALEIDG